MPLNSFFGLHRTLLDISGSTRFPLGQPSSCRLRLPSSFFPSSTRKHSSSLSSRPRPHSSPPTSLFLSAMGQTLSEPVVDKVRLSSLVSLICCLSFLSFLCLCVTRGALSWWRGCAHRPSSACWTPRTSEPRCTQVARGIERAMAFCGARRLRLLRFPSKIYGPFRLHHFPPASAQSSIVSYVEGLAHVAPACCAHDARAVSAPALREPS